MSQIEEGANPIRLGIAAPAEDDNTYEGLPYLEDQEKSEEYWGKVSLEHQDLHSQVSLVFSMALCRRLAHHLTVSEVWYFSSIRLPYPLPGKRITSRRPHRRWKLFAHNSDCGFNFGPVSVLQFSDSGGLEANVERPDIWTSFQETVLLQLVYWSVR